ncbi:MULTISPECIES: DUF3006 domain-containing protein [Bacillaceae]|uniref:DUF3006 domain-containing protein n=1 Tax=Evansella alkalicola TaxID=745819 RepID=A0ABS6JSC7_9BACI|nr:MULTISPECIES: DUF3006 domain-containing protein [Bacillaceae]MBU9721478.1 DUF3006 domain-containing protein [Bacillus alkalicola]
MKKIKAVVDRIVDGKHVVLLIGDEEEEKVVPLNKFPDEIKEGTWLIIDFSDTNKDIIQKISIDQRETDTRKQRIKSKMELLRERSTKGRND